MRNRTLALLMLSLAAPVLAQEGERHARIRDMEPGVTLQRASESGAEEASPNVPFLPGDRVWTDSAGRVEFQFDDGSIVRVDSRSKLDYLGQEERRAQGPISLRLWSGGLYLHTRRDSAGFEVETPGGIVETPAPGIYRIDVDAGETRLSVYDGEATLDSGRRRVTVGEGQRSYARRGDVPERPQRFDRSDEDDFARWDGERESRQAYTADSRRYLPDEVAPYAGELEAHGSWYYETEVGYVWRPYVTAGWRPYADGRWCWTAYGWTWVPYETWGWAPYHYGRWGYSPALSWYWIPGRVWGPAWVSWAVSSDYVGWCPLGYRDRPVIVGDYRNRGNAVLRGSLDASASKAWVFARRGDITARDLAKRRVDVTPLEVRDVRILDQPHARPTRDLRGTEVHTMLRDVKTKPTIGDTVPELRTDPTTTIPAPVARRSRWRDADPSEPREDRNERFDKTREVGTPRAPSENRDAHRPADVRIPEREDRHPTDTRSPQRPRSAPEARERDEERTRPSAPERDVLRRFFQPVSEPRPRGGDGSDGYRSRPEGASPRSEPRAATPPPRSEPQRSQPQAQPQRTSPPPSSGNAVKRPEKEKP